MHVILSSSEKLQDNRALHSLNQDLEFSQSSLKLHEATEIAEFILSAAVKRSIDSFRFLMM